MKPKRQKTRIGNPVRVGNPHKGLNPRVNAPLVGVTWETYLRIKLDEYQKFQEELQARSWTMVSSSQPSSGRPATFAKLGPNGPVSTVTGNAVQSVRKKTRDRYPVNHGDRGRGGVMTDNTKVVNGRRTIETISTGGSPPATTSTTVVQSQVAYVKALDLVDSHKGDHKRPNPHAYRITKTDNGSGVTYSGDNRNATRISGTQAIGYGFGGISFHDMTTAVYNTAVSRLYDKLRGDVDLSVDAFQARQTGVMLSHRFSQARKVFVKAAPEALWAIGGLVTTLKRSNPRDWGNLWLEWVYGWKPLAADIYGSMENMILSSKKGSGISGHPINVSATEIGDERVIVTVDGNNVRTEKLVFSRYRSKIVAFYALTTGGLNSVANYTSLNPVSIAWELVPYSFVVDWFVNVGGYLRNLESSLLFNSDFSYGYRSTQSKTVEVHRTGGGNATYSAVGNGSNETRRFNRIVLNSSPMPRTPSFNPKLGTSRLLSAASLLGQQLHSLKHSSDYWRHKP